MRFEWRKRFVGNGLRLSVRLGLGKIVSLRNLTRALDLNPNPNLVQKTFPSRWLTGLLSSFILLPSSFFLLLLAFGLLFSLPLHAEVFWRVPKTSDTVLRQMGGIRVYATDVRLNGSPGTLTTYTFDRSPALRVSADLARSFGLASPATSGTLFLTHAEKDRLSRLFILPSPSGNEACIVLAFDQSLRDAAKAREHSPAWPNGLPALTATPVFSAVCAQTRTTFVTAESSAAPEAAAQEAAQALRDAGWDETTPATATFKIFASGRKQCVLLATRKPQSERTTISLLQREGATP